MTRPRHLRPEFSRPFALAALGDLEVVEEIEALPDERVALAKRFGLLAIDRLRATLRLTRPQGETLIRVAGQLDAAVTQACVVTLNPVTHSSSGTFTLLFNAAAQTVQGEREIAVNLEEEPVEPLPPDGMDLGEITAEQLALTLNPYPRSEGAELEPTGWGSEASEEGRRPFADLGTLLEPKE